MALQLGAGARADLLEAGARADLLERVVAEAWRAVLPLRLQRAWSR